MLNFINVVLNGQNKDNYHAKLILCHFGVCPQKKSIFKVGFPKTQNLWQSRILFSIASICLHFFNNKHQGQSCE